MGSIKNWIIGILTLGASVLFGLWKSQQAARAEEQLNRVKLGKESKERADKALIDGLQNEKKVQDEKVTDTDINRFYD